MVEYIVHKCADHADLQNLLNQWRYNYELEIVDVHYHENGQISVIIKRTS